MRKAGGQAMEFTLEFEKHGGARADGQGDEAMLVSQKGADGEHEQRRDFGGDAGVEAGRGQIGAGRDHQGESRDGGRQRDRAEQRGGEAEHRNQGEGAEPGQRTGRMLTLQADDQAEAERDGEVKKWCRRIHDETREEPVRARARARRGRW